MIFRSLREGHNAGGWSPEGICQSNRNQKDGGSSRDQPPVSTGGDLFSDLPDHLVGGDVLGKDAFAQEVIELIGAVHEPAFAAYFVRSRGTNRARNASRARLSLDMTVPMGKAKMSAIS